MKTTKVKNTTADYKFDKETEKRLEEIGVYPASNKGQYHDSELELFVYAEKGNCFTITTSQRTGAMREKWAADRIKQDMMRQLVLVQKIVDILTEDDNAKND